MRYLGKVNDPKDLATKEYVDGKVSGVDVSTKQDRTDLLTEDNDFIIGVPETCKVPYYTADGAENYSCSLNGLLTGAILNQAGTGSGILRADNGVVSKVTSIGTSDITEKAVTASKLGTDVTYSAIGLTLNQVRNIYIGTNTPSASTGNDGDIYIKYNA